MAFLGSSNDLERYRAESSEKWDYLLKHNLDQDTVSSSGHRAGNSSL
jgi:hypothetical protein